MKKLINVTFIILIFFPMLIYLNPFTWGMRRMPHYEPTSKTTNLLSNLNKKYKIKMEPSNNYKTGEKKLFIAT
jgi:hypothetical protein